MVVKPNSRTYFVYTIMFRSLKYISKLHPITPYYGPKYGSHSCVRIQYWVIYIVASVELKQNQSLYPKQTLMSIQ